MKGLKILIVGLVKSEQLERVREEAEKKGHSVRGCYTRELVIEAGDGPSGAEVGFGVSLRGEDLSQYDLIYLWATGKRKWEWFTACKFLREKYGTIIVSQKAVDTGYNYYLTPAIDYLKQVENGLPFPRSAVVFDAKAVDSVAYGFDFPVILKGSGGRKGKSVFKIETLEELKEKIVAERDNPHAKAFVIREFIPNDGDIRVFTIGYKAIGAMRRIPPEGDFRSNISAGGSGEKFDLEKTPIVRKIAEGLSELLRTEIAGVDIILDKNTGKPYILELNPGPQFTGFEKYTGINAAKAMVEYFEERVDENQ